MAYKSLSESAAEVLRASMATAGKEPLTMTPIGADLGGATPTEFSTDIGGASSAAVEASPKPGLEGAPAEPIKKVGENPEVVEDEEEMIEDDLDEQVAKALREASKAMSEAAAGTEGADMQYNDETNNSGGLPVMEQDNTNALVEQLEGLSEEELEQYLATLSEEQVAELSAMVKGNEAEQINEASLAKLAANHWKNHSAAAYGGNEGYSEKQLNRYKEKADKILSDISQTHGADVAKAVKQHSSDAAEMENASAGNVDKNFHKNFANNVLGGVGSKNHEKYKSYVDREGANHHLDEDDEEEKELSEEEIFEMKKAAMKDMVAKHKGTMKEDVDALFNGESLSEEFRVKATLIFESAVNSRVEKIVEHVLVENDEVLAAAYDEIKDELTEQVDEYLNYVVEQWMEQNQVAVETGLRSELAEDFISGLRNLFQEHYIEIPEEKLDVAEELANELTQVGEYVAAQDQAIEELAEQLSSVKKEKAISRMCEGLTAVQAEKMKSLAESVEFTAEGDFDNKLAVIRENYFPSKTNVKSEVKEIQKNMITEEPEVEQTHGIMAHYVKAITKTAPKA